MVGKTISHFRILAKLGEGGMGVVYRAEDTSLRRPVALKVLPPELVSNEERRLRFLREARAAAAVTHPNIATIYEVGESEGQVFIAMELVEGKTLREVIAGRPMQIDDVLRIAPAIAEGLSCAHQARVIHRDLKPDNIIVRAARHVKILDFGLAKLIEAEAAADLSKLDTLSREMTVRGKVFGTVAYMSPEQARGDPVDLRSDIFSFGVTLYEMVTGRVPFAGRTSLDTLSAILREEPKPASELNPQVPAELGRIIGKCLEKDPRHRYQHSEEVVLDLERLKRQIDSGAQRSSAGGAASQSRTLPTAARRSWLLSRGSAVVGVGAVVFAALLGFNAGGLRDLLSGAPAPGRIDSLAVLPLENLSGDPAQEYFADGMTEELIANLAQISALRVISRTSAMQYKGKRKPLPEIARELNVDAVVEGSVLQSGERVRITAQLVEAATDRHLWAHSYERDLRDVLSLQGEVARAIAQEIRVTLTPRETARLGGGRQVKPEAYRFYLQGRHHGRLWTEEGFRKAIEYQNRAIALDPDYAQAWAGISWAHIAASEWYVPPREAGEMAERAALKAVELDEEGAEGHASLGFVSVIYGWDAAACERESRRAIALNSNLPDAYYALSWCLLAQRRHEESAAAAKRAVEVDPLSMETRGNEGMMLYFARDYDRAIDILQQALELDPDHFATWAVLGWAYTQQGRWPEAVAAHQRARKANENPWTVAQLGHAYAAAGRSSEAREIVRELERLSSQRYVAGYDLALVYTGLGDKDRALQCLERAYQDRSFWMCQLPAEPRFDPLRADPRFKALLRRSGFAAD